MKGYEDRKIPLDVLVTDMDWHITFYKEADAGKKDQVQPLYIHCSYIVLYCIVLMCNKAFYYHMIHM